MVKKILVLPSVMVICMTVHFDQGMAVYELTEEGIKLAVDFTGTRYWKDDDLN